MALTYSIITPVKDEVENLERLAASIEQQSETPREWVIVDTGSTDGTNAVIAELVARLPFARAMSVDGPALPTRGGPVVRAFTAGVKSIAAPTDIAAKIDADVSFDHDYFERILDILERDPALGIVSGLAVEPSHGTWKPVYGTRSYVAGPSRIYRWACLQAVLPLDERRGWDEIDAVKAQLQGWSVGTLPTVTFRHNRQEGGRDVDRRARWTRQGGEAHFMGYRFSYVCARSAWRAKQDPFALCMIPGYVRAAARHESQCSDPAVLAHIRRQQRLESLPRRAREALGRAF